MTRMTIVHMSSSIKRDKTPCCRNRFTVITAFCQSVYRESEFPAINVIKSIREVQLHNPFAVCGDCVVLQDVSSHEPFYKML